MITFELRQLADDHHEARVKHRDVWWTGKSAPEAIGNMLQGVAELARSGALNPLHPERPGSPPLQHVMELLEEQLAAHIALRRDRIELQRGELALAQPDIERSLRASDPWVDRIDHVIAGLGTAVAALARIREL